MRGLRRCTQGVFVVLLAAAGLAPAHAAGSGSLPVSAVVLTNSICRFLTGAATLTIGGAGGIDPSLNTPATGTATMQFWCLGGIGVGTTYSVQMGNGMHSPGAGLRRVRHASVTTEMMPYTLTVTPQSGSIGWLAVQTITFNASIAPLDFQNARFGAYSDTVVIDLDP